MQNKKNYKSTKADVMRGLLRHSKTKKLFKDAVDSPMGSTSRSQAKKILKIMGRVHLDGQGGPGIFQPQEPQNPELIPSHIPSEPKNVVFFKKIPTPRINYGPAKGNASRYQPRPGQDGMGGPGYDGRGGSVQVNIPGQSPGVAGGAITQAEKDAYAASLKMPPAPKYVPSPAENLWSGIKSIPSTLAAGVGSIAQGAIDFRDKAYEGAVNAVAAPFTPSYDTSATDQFLAARQAAKTPPVVSPVAGAADAAKKAATPPAVDPSYTPVVPLSYSGTAGGAPTISYNAGTSYPSYTPTSYTSTGDTSVSPEVSTIANAIMMKESVGQNIRSTKPSPRKDGSLDWAYGKYQIMGDNIPSWTKEALGTAMTIEQFMADPAAQDKVAMYKMNQYYQQTGNVRDVASLWFTGRTEKEAAAAGNIPDANRTTPPQYIDGIISLYNKGPVSPYTGGAATGGTAGGLTSFAQGAVASGLGPQTTANLYMQQPSGPYQGKNLEEILKEKSDTIWEKYNLDDLTKRQEDLIAAGPNIQPDMEANIRARDTYLKEVQGAIREYETKMSTMDLTDPTVRNNSTNYINYLYTLKGRANQRYMGYVNAAITRYNGDVTSTNSQIASALQNYNNEVARMTTATTADYDRIANGIADLYNTIEQAPLKKIQEQYARVQLSQIDGSTAGAAVDAAFDLPEAAANLQKAGILDSDKYVNPGVDLINVINTMAASGDNRNAVLTAYNQAVLRELQAADGAKKADGFTLIDSTSKRKLAENTIRQYKAIGQAGIQAGNMATAALAENLIDQVITSSGLGETAASFYAPEKAAAVRGLINYLGTKTGMFGWYGGAPSRDDFIIKASEAGVPESIANLIYDDFETYIKTGSNAQQFAQTWLKGMKSDQAIGNKMMERFLTGYKISPTNPTIGAGTPSSTNQA